MLSAVTEEDQWATFFVLLLMVFYVGYIAIKLLAWRYVLKHGLHESVSAPPTVVAPGFDDFGPLPVHNRDQKMMLAAMYLMAQQADYESDHEDDLNADLGLVSPVSYVAGRYPEPQVQYMMLNGRDMVLNDAQRQEMEVWGTINGVPIEDFDDWRG